MPHYLVTGASSGIGAALATALLRLGDKVTAMARREDRLAALDDSSGNFHGSACDVTDAAALATAIEDAIDKQGPVDCAILNAGMYVPQDSLKIDPAVYARHMDVNYMGVVNALPPLIAGMAARRSGQIAIVSSVAGWRGLPKAAAYGPTKAALISLAESLTFDLAPRGIDVKVICPGFVRTESTAVNDYEMPGLISAETAAAEILKGLRTDSFIIQFPKHFTRKMGLLRWLPDRTFFKLVGARTGHPQP
ncbi:MAG: SDR family NAD(P)-dependent oxidoreductase [Pseudomonadota bacterium]|nr:SDR family NAD(P)-dependent oxidoreductase [Pseudomonadota bacterium]